MNPQKYGLIKGLWTIGFMVFRGGFGRDRLPGWPAICQTGPGGLPEWLADLAPKEPRVRQRGGKFFVDGHASKAFRKLKTSNFRITAKMTWYMIYKMSLYLSGVYTYTHNFTCFKWTLKVSGQWCRDIVIRHWLFCFLTRILHGDMWSFILLAGHGFGLSLSMLIHVSSPIRSVWTILHAAWSNEWMGIFGEWNLEDREGYQNQIEWFPLAWWCWKSMGMWT